MPPRQWNATPEAMLLSGETRAYIEAAVRDLKPAQREVITLRDIHGLSSSEVCQIQGITETNQRVLRHRARSKVRRALERYFETGDAA
jgi:RNA polymerase sigma-70 factor (ECF subfamily)